MGLVCAPKRNYLKSSFGNLSLYLVSCQNKYLEGIRSNQIIQHGIYDACNMEFGCISAYITEFWRPKFINYWQHSSSQSFFVLRRLAPASAGPLQSAFASLRRPWTFATEYTYQPQTQPNRKHFSASTKYGSRRKMSTRKRSSPISVAQYKYRSGHCYRIINTDNKIIQLFSTQ